MKCILLLDNFATLMHFFHTNKMAIILYVNMLWTNIPRLTINSLYVPVIIIVQQCYFAIPFHVLHANFTINYMLLLMAGLWVYQMHTSWSRDWETAGGW